MRITFTKRKNGQDERRTEQPHKMDHKRRRAAKARRLAYDTGIGGLEL